MSYLTHRLNIAPSSAAYLPCVAQQLVTPVGILQLNANPYGLSHLTVVGSSRTDIPLANNTADDVNRAKAHICEAVEQLEQYFAGKRLEFELALAPKGTDFQRQVWQALLDVDYGQSCSYADIAEQIGRPKAVRAVGAANGANPIAIIVPCHRVIGKNGKLTGYAYGLEMKQQLLMLESASKRASFTLE